MIELLPPTPNPSLKRSGNSAPCRRRSLSSNVRPHEYTTSMHILFTLSTVIAASAALGLSIPAAAADEDPSLLQAITKADFEAFDAFNRCKDPAQLQKHASYFSPTVEFYHDNGGVTWNRDAMIANTKKYVCGNYRRELIAGSLRVFPIKDFGAIEQGTHRFCSFEDNKCEGMADFTTIWQNVDGKWQMTRVLSYGHRANKPSGPSTQ